MSSGQDHQGLVILLERALKQWHYKEVQISLDEMLPHLYRQLRAEGSISQVTMSPQGVNQLLLMLLEKLAERDPEAALLLRRRYIDDETGFSIANSLGISESAFYRQRREALSILAEVALIQEQQAQLAHIARLENRLEPPSYHRLFGLSDIRNRLRDLLCAQSDIRLFCLTGIGGIGKTVLAHALARDIIAVGCFDDLAWISARQQQFAPWGEIQETLQPVLTPDELITSLNQQLSGGVTPPRPSAETLPALKDRLAKKSHLIILDNLETVADYQELLPLLHELSQWAWILITSRVSIQEQPDVHVTNVAELSLKNATSLIHDEAHRRGMDDLAHASTDVMKQVYSVAGGNPLALKLIVGQVQVRSLSVVLVDLNEARGRRTEALYEFIYRQAWELLDDTTRRVLLAMPLVAAPGTTLEHLAGFTGLSHNDLYDALEHLIRLSLVDVGGPLDERRYQIHRLTETFLHKQVTKWG